MQGIIQNTTCSVCFRIQRLIQNTRCSVWFIIPSIIQKWSGYYSPYGSEFRVLFKIRTAASGSSFRLLLKRGQGIVRRMVQDSGFYSKHDLQRLVQDSAYYSKYELQRLVHYSEYYSKMVRILYSVRFSIQGIIENTTCSVCFRIQGIIQNTNCSVWFIIQRIIQKRPGYYLAYSSGFRVLFKTRPAASGSGFSVLFKIRAAASGSLFMVLFETGHDIIQRKVQFSGYY